MCRRLENRIIYKKVASDATLLFDVFNWKFSRKNQTLSCEAALQYTLHDHLKTIKHFPTIFKLDSTGLERNVNFVGK